MVDGIFPISGPLKEPLLIMEWIIVLSFLELATIFWIRIRSKKQELKSLQEKAYVWLFFGYSIEWIFIIISDYYIDSEYLRSWILNLGYFILIFCALVFIYIIEKYKVFVKKYFFTLIFSIMIMVYILLLFIDIYYATLISHAFWLVFVIFFIMYLKKLGSDYYIKRHLGSFKIEFLKFCIGVLLLVIGYQLTLSSAIRAFGLSVRLFGDILQLIALFLLFLFFISIPSFSEFDWQEKIISVFIMYKSGLFIYKKDFRENIDSIDDSITTGTITVLKMMLDNVSKKEDISVIEKQDKIIIIQPGRYIIGAIICDEKLNSIQILLNKFIEKIETIYSHVLASWNGNLDVFKPIEDIVKEIFY